MPIYDAQSMVWSNAAERARDPLTWRVALCNTTQMR